VKKNTCEKAGFRAKAAVFLVTSSLIPLPSSLARAAHPFITDDTGTQGAGNWQLELMAQRDRHSALGDAGAGPVQQRARSIFFNPVLTYGITETVDVALGLSYLDNRTSESGVPVAEASGKGDSTLEVKWRFLDRDGSSLALKPGLSLATGDEHKGLGTGRIYPSVDLIGMVEGKSWAAFANIAHSRPRYRLAQDAANNRNRSWRISAGATLAVGGNVRLAGEAGARANESRDDPFLPGRHGRFGMLGAIYSPTGKIDLDIGVRKALNRAETDTVLLMGATLRW
jgi:hypothetical protein